MAPSAGLPEALHDRAVVLSIDEDKGKLASAGMMLESGDPSMTYKLVTDGSSGLLNLPVTSTGPRPGVSSTADSIVQESGRGHRVKLLSGSGQPIGIIDHGAGFGQDHP